MNIKEKLLKKSLSGNTAAKQKLINLYENDIRFICRCLTDDKDSAEKAGNWAINTIHTENNTIRTVDEFTKAVRRTAVETALQNYAGSVPAAVHNENSVLPVPDKTVMLPESAIKNEALISQAGELIYYCTSRYEYRFFILYYYCRLEINEIAELFHTDTFTVASEIAGAEIKIRSSLQTLSSGSGNTTETDFYFLTGAIAAIKPKEKKKQAPVLSPLTKKIAGIAVFCVALILIVCGIFIAAFRNVNNNESSAEETAIYLKSDHRTGNEMMTENNSKDTKLYNYLITDRTVSLVESGLSNDGFVIQSESATLLELIIIDSSSELITEDQLEITFSDDSPIIENGKRFFTQTVHPIDERTFLIRIYAPGNYSPDQFRIDLYMYGLKDSSYNLPTQTTDIADISGLDIITNKEITNQSAQEHGIIGLSAKAESGEMNYYYIESSLSYISEADENVILGIAELTLLPIGNKYGKPDEKDFSFELGQYEQSLSSDKMVETKCIFSPEYDTRKLPYVTKLVYEISMNFADSSSENDSVAQDILRGCFVYKGSANPLIIELERY